LESLNVENLSLTEVKDECQRLLTKNRSLLKEIRELKKTRDIPEGDELNHAKEALSGIYIHIYACNLLVCFFSFSEERKNKTLCLVKLILSGDNELDLLFFHSTALKGDRKRLKAEKFELLNQMKQLYSTLEDKEKELRDFIRNYEQVLTK
jgi:hypothetical protein